MKQFLGKLLAGLRHGRQRPGPQRKRAVVLRVEAMEERLALSTVAAVSVVAQDSHGLIIVGGMQQEALVRTTGMSNPREVALLIRGFNPQPEPPGSQMVAHTIRAATPDLQATGMSPAEVALMIHGFNPQPEPPG
jgi:hypothetical protein